MRRNTEQRTVRGFIRRMPTINLQPTFQRGVVWSKKQKQLLIDSILNDLDIPKIYLHEIDEGSYKEEAVDGQQRLTAITEFYNNDVALSKRAKSIRGISVKGKKFKDLDEDLKDVFESYEFTVVTLRDASIEEVEEMFLRLQNGTSLNPAEKRNAMPGEMTEFVRQLAQHPFFLSCGFNNNRFTYDNIAAQMVRVALSKEPNIDVGNTELIKLYEENIVFDFKGVDAKKVLATLDYLFQAFPEKTPELSKLTALSLFAVADYLRKNYSVKGMAVGFGALFLKFEKERYIDSSKRSNERKDTLKVYEEACASSTGAKRSVGIRFNTLLWYYLEEIPGLPPLAAQRSFNEEQRRIIFRRDQQVCQIKVKCTGKVCSWDDWHADHIVPWNKGGGSTIENGQVACVDCNLSKGG
ncbi:MAG: DUF262 domain-containing protein [Cycloclasticus sp.]